jgi:hypothetical protein
LIQNHSENGRKNKKKKNNGQIFTGLDTRRLHHDRFHNMARQRKRWRIRLRLYNVPLLHIEMTKLQKIRAWAQEHRGVLRLLVGFIQFVLALIFFNGAMIIMSQVPNGIYIMAGTILLMIAGFFWKGAVDFQDGYYEDRTALDEVMKLRDDLESNDLLDSKR